MGWGWAPGGGHRGRAAIGELEPAPRDGPVTLTNGRAWASLRLASDPAQTHCTEKGSWHLEPHCREQSLRDWLVLLLPEFSSVHTFLSKISPYSVIISVWCFTSVSADFIMTFCDGHQDKPSQWPLEL